MRKTIAIIVILVSSMTTEAVPVRDVRPMPEVAPACVGLPDLSGHWCGYQIEQDGRAIVITGQMWNAIGWIGPGNIIAIYWTAWDGRCAVGEYTSEVNMIVGRWRYSEDAAIHFGRLVSEGAPFHDTMKRTQMEEAK